MEHCSSPVIRGITVKLKLLFMSWTFWKLVAKPRLNIHNQDEIQTLRYWLHSEAYEKVCYVSDALFSKRILFMKENRSIVWATLSIVRTLQVKFTKMGILRATR